VSHGEFLSHCHACLETVAELVPRWWESRSRLQDTRRVPGGEALELGADLAEAHASRGLALSTVDRLDEAEAEFKTAIDLDPNLYEAHYFYGRACFSQGRMEEAAEHFQRAAEIMPNDFEAPLFLVQLYLGLGREDEALSVGRRGFENTEQELAARPENVRAAYLGAGYLVHSGEQERAREWVDRALAIEPDDFLTQYNAACILANLGDIDQAIDLLESALPQAHSEIRGWVKHDADLDPLRSSCGIVRNSYHMSVESTGRTSPRTRGESVRRLQTGLRRLGQGLHRLNDAVGTHVELLSIDLSVLDLVDREGPMSPRNVTDLTGIHPATLTGILDRLEHGGWLARRPDPDDRRRTIVEAVSDRGGELVQLYAPMSRAVAALCAEYSPEELAAIVDFVERAADAGEAATQQVRTASDP